MCQKQRLQSITVTVKLPFWPWQPQPYQLHKGHSENYKLSDKQFLTEVVITSVQEHLFISDPFVWYPELFAWPGNYFW